MSNLRPNRLFFILKIKDGVSQIVTVLANIPFAGSNICLALHVDPHGWGKGKTSDGWVLFHHL